MIRDGVYKIMAHRHGAAPHQQASRLAARFLIDNGSLHVLEDHFGHHDAALPEGTLDGKRMKQLVSLLQSGYYQLVHEDDAAAGEHPEHAEDLDVSAGIQGAPAFKVKGGDLAGKTIRVLGDTVLVDNARLPDAQASELLSQVESGDVQLEVQEEEAQ